MKKILALALVALFVMASVCFAAGPTLNYSGDVLGQNKYQGDPHRVFRLVHISPSNNDSNGIASGSVVVWDDLLDDGISVETTTTSGDSRVAGVLINTVVSDDTGAGGRTASEDAGLNANWGWLQTYGKSAVDVTASAGKAITANDAVCAGETAQSVATYYNITGTANCGVLGFAYDAIAASAAGEIFIRCE